MPKSALKLVKLICLPIVVHFSSQCNSGKFLLAKKWITRAIGPCFAAQLLRAFQTYGDVCRYSTVAPMVQHSTGRKKRSLFISFQGRRTEKPYILFPFSFLFFFPRQAISLSGLESPHRSLHGPLLLLQSGSLSFLSISGHSRGGATHVCHSTSVAKGDIG